MEKVVKASEMLGVDNFLLTARISDAKPKPPRWDKEWIKKQLIGNDVVRCWVCGPPIMNETFDKTFHDLWNEKDSGFTLKKGDVDLM